MCDLSLRCGSDVPKGVSHHYLSCIWVSYSAFARACSVVSDSLRLWPAAHLAPLSMEFSRQEYWSGLPCPPPADLPHPGIASLASPALLGGFFNTVPCIILRPRLIQKLNLTVSDVISFPHRAARETPPGKESEWSRQVCVVCFLGQ